MITTETVKKLRDQTGISIMQCKKALEEAGGDMEKALVLLRKKGASIAAKKADRTLGSGTIAAYVHGNGSIAALVSLSCETDFVSNNEEFKHLAYDIAMQVAASNPEFLSINDVPEESKKVAREVFAAEVAGKPEAMREKIMEGKLAAYFKEKTLLDQPFIKNPDMSVKDLIESAIQKFGEKIEMVKFVRFSL
ncbi:MAG: elongation factor Ts [Candidatus Taylorbacteria bacterium RIFCSPHIGHO2_01_FULL_46_22b]|uniref:Elongation factor Ts n=1 Tax=Candidatus Taylorbacteria bacterium RIFCSPHIGHO2_01_FULL_46_22b TaxID=1802301 RepID=A0A1G2M440_9BACT|nr:MAG: elongation factor Ts [Candidatus Taylorbacteria bacterium RIFCSPHIGHO2_01_FULL_46_22b]